jgi:hypothetical protein
MTEDMSRYSDVADVDDGCELVCDMADVDDGGCDQVC